VADAGGGLFVPRGDGDRLAEATRELIENPEAIRNLTASAAASGAKLDRDTAIQNRIELMKTHLRRESAPGRA
jgi:hypothetical protein